MRHAHAHNGMQAVMPMVGGGISFQLEAAAGSERGVAECRPRRMRMREERLMQFAAR